MGIVTEGRHPWNLHPNRDGEKRECPKCRGRIIENDKCAKCGYEPMGSIVASSLGELPKKPE